MSEKQSLFLYYDALNRVFFGAAGSAFRLVQGDYVLLKVQATNKQQFAANADGTAPDTDAWDWTDYTAGSFALKTIPNYGSGGAAEASWSGFVTGNAFHNLAKGRFVLGVTVSSATAAKLYKAEFELQTGAGDKWTLGPLFCRVVQQAIS